MKKMFILLTAVLALSLTACDKADNSSENISGNNSEIGGENSLSNSTGESTGSTEQNAPDMPSTGANPIMLANEDYPAHDWYSSFGTDDGIYNIKEAHSKEIGTYGYIMYTDYASGQEVYLCSDSSCNHNTERCSSYLHNRDFIIGHEPRLFVYNNSLYYLSVSAVKDVNTATITTGVPYEDDRPPRLYRMELDGSNRELVYTFDKELGVLPFAAGDGNALWFFVKTPTMSHDEERHVYFYATKDPTLIKLDLSTRDIVEQIPLYKYNDLERISVWGCADGKIIFRGQELPEGMTREQINAEANFDDPNADSLRVRELYKKFKSVYFTLDLNNKDIKEIYRHVYADEYTSFTDGKYAYLTNTEEMTSVRIDIESGEQSEFYPAEGYVAIGMIGDKYNCRSVDKDDITSYFIDKQSGEMTSNSLEALYTDEHWGMYPDLFPEERFYKPISKDVLAYSKDYVLISSLQEYNSADKYWVKETAVMSLDDYLNGIMNYRTVKSDFHHYRT